MSNQLPHTQLEEKNKRIEELERQLEAQKFSTRSIIHDIRNKAQVQQGNLELLLEEAEEGYELTSEDLEKLKTAAKSSNETKKVLENQEALLELENKQDYEIINICEILNDNIRNLESNAYKNGIEISQDYENVEDPRIYTTPLVERTTYNILDNSINYGSNLVEITVEDTEEHVITVIEDDGNGLDEEEYEEMFSDDYTEFSEYPSVGSALIHRTSLGTNIDLKHTQSEKGGCKYTIEIPKPDKDL